MSIQSGRAKLHDGYKQLTLRWQQTQRDWDDPASRAFARKYLQPLDSDVRMAGAAMARLAEVLQQVRRDCGPD